MPRDKVILISKNSNRNLLKEQLEEIRTRRENMEEWMKDQRKEEVVTFFITMFLVLVFFGLYGVFVFLPYRYY